MNLLHKQFDKLLSAGFFFFYLLNAVLFIFNPVYLKEYYDIEQVALLLLLTGVGSGSLMLVNNLNFVHKYIENYQISFFLAISIIGMILFGPSFLNNYFLLCISFFFFGLFYLKKLQIYEIICLKLNLNYPKLKSYGVAGFLFGLIIPVVFTYVDFEILVIYISIVCVFWNIIQAIYFKNLTPKDNKEDIFNFNKLLDFIKIHFLFLVSLFLLSLSNYYNASYLGVYLKDLNYSENVVTWAWISAIVFELIGNLLLYKFFKNKLGLEYVLLLSVIFNFIRFYLYTTIGVNDFNFIIMLGFFHIFTWSFIHLIIMDNIRLKFKHDTELKETLQLYSIIRYFIGPFVASLSAILLYNDYINLFWIIGGTTPLFGFFILKFLKK